MSLITSLGLPNVLMSNLYLDHSNSNAGPQLSFQSNADHGMVGCVPLQGPPGCHPYTYMASARN
jgi:hypothetical protein